MGIRDLEDKRFVLKDASKKKATELLDTSLIKSYIENLITILSTGAHSEEKAFLKSFVKRIESKPPGSPFFIPSPYKQKRREALPQRFFPSLSEIEIRDRTAIDLTILDCSAIFVLRKKMAGVGGLEPPAS